MSRGGAQDAERILVVDDTPANIQALTAILRERGYRISVATNGRQALQVLAQLRPDLILLDVMMPEMDGFETCRRIRENEEWREIPVIFLTARTETADIVQGFELGAVDYVAKPFHAHELLARVRTHLTIARLNRENERLLRSILPEPVVRRLQAGEERIADQVDAASVLFADIVGFTPLAARLSPDQVVEMLDDLFTRFDALCVEHGVEKIKTIGDCYMAVCGVPESTPDHAERIADLALAMLAELRRFNEERDSDLHLRIGLHTGPLVAGVIGRSKFIYDLWGDTVNIASRMESTGVADRVQASESMRAALAEQFELEERGDVEVKGKGRLRSWLLLGRRR